jgi:RHS repeat-associated protein
MGRLARGGARGGLRVVGFSGVRGGLGTDPRGIGARVVVSRSWSMRAVGLVVLVALGACLALLDAGVASATPPTSAVGYVYDADGQLRDVSDPAGNTGVFKWDAVGNLLSISRAASSALSVVQLTPARGAVGDTVTIAGTGFSTTPASNTVKFNGTTATVTAATARLLTLTVPTGATTGTVSVTAPSGGPVSSSQTFTVGASTAPKITSLSSTLSTAGSTITISGSNFVANTIGNVTRVAQNVAEMTSTTTSSIQFKVPAATGSGAVSVATAQGTATGPDLFIPPGGTPTTSVGPMTRLTLGSAKAMSFASAGKVGLALFDGQAGQQVSLQLSQLTMGSGAYGEIFAPDDTTILAQDFVPAPDGGMIDTVTLPTTGTYTALIDPLGQTGSLSLTAYDAHDVMGTLSPSAGGDTKALSVTVPGQNARYSVTATAGEQVSLNMTGSTFARFDTEWLNPDGSVLTAQPGWGSGDSFYDQTTLPSAGTYTLVIDPFGAQTGSMSITAFNATDVTGTLAPSLGGDAKALNLAVPGQNASYTFAGQANQSVSLGLTNSTIAFGTATIYNPDGSILGYGQFDTTGGAVLPLTLPSTGTYTATVDPLGTDTGQITLTGYLGSGMGLVRRAVSRGSLTGVAAGPLDAPFPASTAQLVPDTGGAASAPGSSSHRFARRHARRRSGRVRELAPGSVVTEAMAKVPPSGPLLWRAGAANRRGLGWSTGRRSTPWADAPLARAADGATALAGRALTLDGLPLAGVRVSIEDTAVSGRTGRDGRFLLSGASAGHHVLVVDGTPASRRGVRFGIFEIGVDLLKGRTTDLPATIWMTALDPAGDHRIASPTRRATVLTTPQIPGLEVRLPAGTVIKDAGGKVVRRLNITQVPVDRPPFPLPAHVRVPVYFTVQPGRAYLSEGAQIIYPNYSHLPAGQRVDFWNYDADARGWYIYGKGTVTPDAKQVIPDPNVRIWEFTGAMISSDVTPPAVGPAVGGGASSGDPVDLHTGLFAYHKTDLVLADAIPIVVDHTYRQGDANSYSFGLGAASSYDMRLWSVNNYQSTELVMPDGGRVHYVRTSPGTGYGDAVYQAQTTPGTFFGSTIAWDTTRGGWDLTLRDGLTYYFGAYSPLQAIFDRYGNQLTITRDPQTGDISQITSPHGRWVRFTYDASNRITQARDDGGRTVGYTYDTSGRLATVTDAASRVTTYGYNASNQMTSVKNGRNTTYVTTSYDTNGRVLGQGTGDGGSYGFAYTLDGSGNVTATTVTDPRSIQRKVTFNTDGYPTSDVEALGDTNQQTTTFERQTGTDQLLSVTDPRGRKTAYQYNSAGDITQVTQLAGTGSARSSTYTYEPFDQLATVTDPLGHTTTYHHGSHGELLSTTDPLGHQTSYTHDPDGQFTSITNALGKTTTLGYVGGDLVSITDPLGRKATQFLDSVGRLASTTTPGGQRTVYDHDGDDALTKVTDPLGAVTTYGYDGDENLTSVTDALNHTTSATYDPMDRLASVTDPLTHATQAVYDKNGNLTQLTDRRGKVSTYTYDALNRRTQAKYGVVAGTPQSTVTYSYDNGNRLAQVVDTADGTYTPTYDDFDRLTSIAGPLGTIGYSYDNADRRTSMTVPGQSQVTYGYDNADRLTSLTRGSQNVTLGYDNADRFTSTTLPDGILETNAYDDADQLTSTTYKLGATTLGDLDYDYDSNGHRTAMWGSYARTNIPAAMASATYNAENERTAQGATTLTYDTNGNLTSDGTSTYTWDARSQLASIAGPTTASFGYDPFGRRTTRTVGAATTKFLYDGPNITQEQVGGSATANLLSGGVDETFARTATTGTDSYLTDLAGSTIALANTAGAVQTSYTYDPFGAVTSTGATSTNPFQFTGRENDATGLDYYRARYYSPTQERFISQDPAGIAASGPNGYLYTGNDPTDMTDPGGMLATATSASAPDFGAFNSISGIDIGSAGIGYAPGSFLGFPTGPILGPPVTATDPGESPILDPKDFAGKTPQQIHDLAIGSGLVPQGPDPMNGGGSYDDPRTGKQRVLSHPNAPDGGHMHVNDPSGNRIGIGGQPVPPESPHAHLPIGTP